MAFVPGFDYDIFISYSHVDDLQDAPGSGGWVKQFHQRLETALAKRIGRVGAVKIWRDERLDGSQLFDRVIENRINRSALFLALTSNGYLQSNYCKKELQHFCEKASSERHRLDIAGERTRVLNILLDNIPFNSWPPECAGSTGFVFHRSERREDLGQPVETDGKEFQTLSLIRLVDAIHQSLESLVALSTSSEALANPNPDDSCDVFIASVADTLKSQRKRLISDLREKNIRVYKDTPPPFTSREHEQAVVDAMRKTKLCVHLLDSYSGAEIEGEQESTYPQKQVMLGQAHANEQLIWVPRTLAIDEIEDEQQKRLLGSLETEERREARFEFMRSLPNEVFQRITEKLDQLKNEAETADRQLAALLDTHKKDQAFAFVIGRYLLERNIQPYINPEEDDPARNIRL